MSEEKPKRFKAFDYLKGKKQTGQHIKEFIETYNSKSYAKEEFYNAHVVNHAMKLLFDDLHMFEEELYMKALSGDHSIKLKSKLIEDGNL